MKRPYFFLLIILVMLHNITIACTTFFLEKNGQMVFGRNYDWVTATGMVNTNLRGVIKHSLDLEHRNVLQWQSKYGSVTFNQYGKEFPNGGMNEKGLVVELMWLSESEYPAPDNRPGLSVLQWIQYQLDNSSTVDEVIATDRKVRIVSTGTPQHYLVGDNKGNVATIEYLNGKMVVHKGSNLPYPVLANDTYSSSIKNASASSSKGFQANSGDRFARACALVQEYKKADTKKPMVDYSFDILNNVSQSNFTKWSIVYDITNRKIFFKTSANTEIKSLDASAFDYSCSSNALAFNMNQNASGNINKLFTVYSNDVNRKMLKEAFNESKNELSVNETLQQGVAQTAESVVKCK
jgi:penicillin V acylase-like amidase (Ntn superfamily)